MAVAAWRKESEGRLARFVRLSPLNSGLVDADLDAVIGAGADALVLSKAEGAASVQALAAKLQGFQIPILPIATETPAARSEEHTSELQSLMRISYAVFCLKQKNIKIKQR